jgi:hypothetical protein
MKQARVYVAGPLTTGDVFANIHEATVAANLLLALGYLPFLPHLTALWASITPRPYEDWMAYDFGWLKACDCLFRLRGESSGADREVAEAHRLGIPVFYTYSSLSGHYSEQAREVQPAGPQARPS